MKHSKSKFLEIPAISILDHTIVITKKGAYETLTIDDKVPDTLDLIEIITENYEIIYLTDINGLIDNKPQTKLIHELSDFCEVWLDAGVSEVEHIYDLFVAGSHEVVLSTKTLHSLLELSSAHDLSENLIFEMDYSDLDRVISPNHQISGMDPKELAMEVTEIGIDRLIFADISKIEKSKSLEKKIIQSLVELDITLYVGGGIKLSDITTLQELGASGAVIELTDILKHGQVEFLSLSIEVLQQAIASLFKRKGKDLLSAKELELLASMELRWFEPAEARKLVELALEMELLEETEGGLKPSFELSKIEIPLGFKPPEGILSSLEHDSESLFMQMVNHICIFTDQDSQQVIAQINDKQAKFENYIGLETIAILYGKEKDVDMDKFMSMVKSKILSG